MNRHDRTGAGVTTGVIGLFIQLMALICWADAKQMDQADWILFGWAMGISIIFLIVSAGFFISLINFRKVRRK